MTSGMIRAAACAAALAAMVASPVMAQELGAEPHFADLKLKAGFEPDPQQVEVTAGGDVDAATIEGGACLGMIGRAPDIRLTYQPDELPLIIKALSSGDTTLAVNDPNGIWFCDDDSAGELNPKVTFSDPQEGVYEIWIGTIESEPVSAVVEITELDD